MPEPDEFRKYCTAQIMRLSGLPGFPFHANGVNELVNFAEKRSGGKRDELRSVIDVCVEYDHCPTIADLRRQWIVLYDPEPPKGCELCHDTPGFRIVERNGVSGAQPCSCRTKGEQAA